MEKQLHLNVLASRPPVPEGGLQSRSKMRMGEYFEAMEDVEVENNNGKDISFNVAPISVLLFIYTWN
ncbi:unnamed protein product [Coregonus sp. 'balchen']|nr:unnamed protein product [Coregonus sp. 'balchen']